jgi:polyisoprenoid-binding protein YceI/rhodanese-related sulfurtransferase
MGQGGTFVLIDTLTADHFEKVHIPGAKNACVFEVTFLDQVSKVVEGVDQEIVLYGSSGKSMDAETAAKKLSRDGYRNVSILEGGLQQWMASGYGIEGDDSEEPTSAESVPALEAGTYHINTQRSIIEWTGRNPTTTHYGTIGVSSGEIVVSDGGIGGKCEIDMTSIKNINLAGDPSQPVLIAHLMSDDFFFVKRFPKATFSVNSATPLKSGSLSSPNYEITGTLEMLAIKKDITFSGTLSQLDDGSYSVEAHFDIDRTRWNIIYGSSRFFEHLGMHLVFDLISIQLHIVVQ